jgi:predicted Zn-dependent peptidase
VAGGVVAAAAVVPVVAATGADRPLRPPLTDPVTTTGVPSGIRIVTEAMPEVRSVTVGCYVVVGGRDEPDELAGASHFLEHLLFKGTEQRPARAIAQAVDARGGEMNAFTSREHTAFYLRVPAAELAFAVDLLADVVTMPAFRPEEVDSERQVILEELLLSEDEPDERVHTLCFEALFPGHPLGREVLGTAETVEAMTRDQIAAFHAAHYRPANLVVVAAGDLEHEAVVAGVDGRCGPGGVGSPPVRLAPTVGPEPVAALYRSTEQAHLAVGWRAFDLHDPDRYPLAVLNQVLGGGMSSRLFQEIREDRGLAYSVYSYTSLHADAGALVVYAGTAPARLAEVRALVRAEVDRVCAEGITAEELAVAAGYLEGSLLLGLEDSGSRMARLGSSLCARGRVTPVDDHVAAIRAVTLADVARVVARVLAGPSTTAAVGPLDDRALD